MSSVLAEVTWELSSVVLPLQWTTEGQSVCSTVGGGPSMSATVRAFGDSRTCATDWRGCQNPGCSDTLLKDPGCL